ncbi:MAG TPA: LamG domain-containing protein [Planctomycetota bacterium]|nr:LamG domain-containing protein [Planctomycetota bacterium]
MNIHDRGVSLIVRVAGVFLLVLGAVSGGSEARVYFFQAAPVIPVPNLVGYWAVDGPVADMATIAQDSSGNNNNGTYTSGATSMAAAPTVPPGNTRSFAFTQAARQYISVPSFASLQLTGSCTLAAWIRPTIDSTFQEGILEKYDGSISDGYSFRLDGNENLSCTMFNGTTAGGVSTAPRAIPLNTWTHVAGVYSMAASTVTNYVNAVADPSVATGVLPPTAGASPLQIGDDYGANAFNGNIDEVRIYNRALTVNEVAVLKNGQPAPTALLATGGTGRIQLTWSPASNAGTVPVTYSLLRGTASGVYTTVTNGIPTTAYDDPIAGGGGPFYYVVVAVSVMTSGPTNEQSATATFAPPPPPRTQKVGKPDKKLCGMGAVEGSPFAPGLLGALAISALLVGLAARRRFQG